MLPLQACYAVCRTGAQGHRRLLTGPVLAAGRRQDAIMARVMDRPDIADVWDSDDVAEAAITLFRSPDFVG